MQPHSRKLASWAIWIGGLSVAVLLPLGHTLAQDDKPRSEPQTTEKKETPDPTPPPPAAEGDSVPVYKKFGNVQFNTTGTQLPPVVDESGVAFGLRSTALEERRGPVQAVALSPDGKRLVTVGGGVKIWDVATAKVLVSVRESETARVAFSPDGKHLATADAKGGLHLRDPATGQVRKSLGRHDPAVHALAFSPDHKLLASSALGAVRLWDVASGKELKELSGHSGLTSSLSFARDGKFLAAGSGSEVRVWELPKGKVVTTIRTPFPVRSAALSPDGKAIATVGSNPTPTLWSVETGKPFGDLKEEKDGIQAYPRGIAETVAFAPNGKIIATAQGAGRVILWDAKTRKEIATFGFEPENPERAYFGVMADPVTRPTTPVATSANTALAFSADGTRLAVNHGMVAVVIDVVKRAHLGKFPRDGAGPQPVLALAYAPDGKTLAVALEDHSVSVREVDTGEELLRLRGHGDKVTCLVFAPDGRTLATGSADNTVKVWDAANGQVRLTFKGHTSWVYAVAFAPSGKTIASGGYDRVIRLWNATTGKEQGVLAGHKGAVRALAFTADGATLASGGADRTIKLWNIAGAAREFAVFDGHKATVRALAFTRNGQTLVSASDDGTAKSWDVVQRKERFTFKGHSDAVIAVAVAPTGTRVATASLTDKVLHV